MIDLRSDTVTRPTPGMMAAISQAQVGDDVIDIDPTVDRLQKRTAEILGKDAAIFMPSGTMTNQIALRVHCQPGDEFLCDEQCHIYNYEQGAFAQLSGLVARTVPGRFGIMSLEQLQNLVRPQNEHMVRTRLLCIENTHNRGAGKIWPLNQLNEVCHWAHDQGLLTHLDGARLFNAEAATGVDVAQWSAAFDSVSVCFSKGLGAPVGSALAGSVDFIAKARRARKLFGGGMRQAGIIASAALYALEHQRTRLVDDHTHATMLGDAVRRCTSFSLFPDDIDSNIVIFKVDPQFASAKDIVAKLEGHGVRAMAFSPTHIRMVTHLDVSRSEIEKACDIVERLGC